LLPADLSRSSRWRRPPRHSRQPRGGSRRAVSWHAWSVVFADWRRYRRGVVGTRPLGTDYRGLGGEPDVRARLNACPGLTRPAAR